MRWSRPAWPSGWARMPAKVFAALEHLKGAPGRMEKVAFAASGAPIYVDYAHTPDSLEKVLEALRPHTAGQAACGVRLRRRPRQGQASADGRRSRRALADDVIVTDDNPRSEDAAAIRSEILAGGAGRARNRRPRRSHSRRASRRCEAGDVLVIAGKGHETGQYVERRSAVPSPTASEAIKAALALGGRAA